MCNNSGSRQRAGQKIIEADTEYFMRECGKWLIRAYDGAENRKPEEVKIKTGKMKAKKCMLGCKKSTTLALPSRGESAYKTVRRTRIPAITVASA